MEVLRTGTGPLNSMVLSPFLRPLRRNGHAGEAARLHAHRPLGSTRTYCPSFRGPVQHFYGGACPERSMMDYIANGGTCTNPDDFSPSSSPPNTYDGALVPSKNVQANGKSLGLVRKLTDISDGTSSTMMVAEKFVGGVFAFDSTEQNH